MDTALPIEYHHKAYMESIPKDKLKRLAHIKRFAELLVGDPDFRQDLQENHQNTHIVAQKYHLEINIDHLRSFWHRAYMPKRRSKEEYLHSPLTVEWDIHLKNIRDHRDRMKTQNNIASKNEAFQLWRTRQLLRCDDTLAASAQGITHPSFAFELSEGCTVGCWFCGIAADKFKGYFAYTKDNQKLWQDMLYTLVNIFGVDTVKTAFCYWATDPSDNPDYASFIADFHHITNFLPQTTTARPVKDIAWTRKILSLYERYKCVFNRFSITTLSQLKAVHKNFTAEELIGTELVMQHKQALSSSCGKSPSGRVLQNIAKLKAAGKDIDKIKNDLKLNDEHTTIACVSGFLINPLTKTIKLVSPRASGLTYPLGYKVHEIKTFTSIESFRESIYQLIEQHMPTHMPNHYRIAFNKGIKGQLLNSGFQLIAQLRTLNINSYTDAEKIGQYLLSEHNKNKPYKLALKELIQSGCNIFSACDILQSLYQYGVFEDE
ncbi:radical SAM family RiPP maturation amino acid epimerase [Facilibium subflavum]|uniref:radical SAM family RiPP maturation amino acid epimerase n=1 Tax=Facilibium subflavum TaxID=2219058 RepID=UPI0013C3174D|nr:radical SAM family RiPP maturation amino acid epimerase [Facilibium subflavum]